MTRSELKQISHQECYGLLLAVIRKAGGTVELSMEDVSAAAYDSGGGNTWGLKMQTDGPIMRLSLYSRNSG